MIPFYVVDPELAAQETRVLNVLALHRGVPAGSYGLLELYCHDPSCHCRRVMLSIREEKSPEEILASINFGFDREAELAGPFLDPLNPQSSIAEGLLDLIQSVILSDAKYIRRLERHYHMMKQAAADPQHPAYERLQAVLTDDATSFPVLQSPHNAQKGKNTGKRHKR